MAAQEPGRHGNQGTADQARREGEGRQCVTSGRVGLANDVIRRPGGTGSAGEAAAWRLRLHDADPDDHASAAAAVRLDALTDDLRRRDYADLWAELAAIGNWLAESDAVSDFAELAATYRSHIGTSEAPTDGAAYLQALLTLARGLT